MSLGAAACLACPRGVIKGNGHLGQLVLAVRPMFSAGKYKKRKHTEDWIYLLALLFGTSKAHMEAVVKRSKRGPSRLATSLSGRKTLSKANRCYEAAIQQQEARTDASYCSRSTHQNAAVAHQGGRDGFQAWPVASVKLRSGTSVTAPAHMFTQGGLLAGLANV